MHYTYFLLNISCIIYNLNALRIAWKIQVMGSLQINDLFITGLFR